MGYSVWQAEFPFGVKGVVSLSGLEMGRQYTTTQLADCGAGGFSCGCFSLADRQANDNKFTHLLFLLQLIPTPGTDKQTWAASL